MALLPDSQATFGFLVQELVHAESDTFAAIRDVLAQYGDVDAACKGLWTTLEDVNQPADRRFRAGMALVSLDASTPDIRWKDLTGFLSAQLAEDLARSPSRFEAWTNSLRPKRQLLLADLRRISREKDRGEPARQMAASALANFFSNERAVLEELFLDADGAQIVTYLEALTIHRDQVQGAMRLALATKTDRSAQETQLLAAARADYQTARQVYDAQANGALKVAFDEAGSRLQNAAAAWEDDCDHRARRVANAAVALFTWDSHTSALVPLLAQHEDPRVRSYLIDRVGRNAADQLDVQAALEILQAGEGDPAVLQAHVLLLGQTPSKLDRSVQAALGEQLLDIYRSHSDSGVHSAAEWTLKRFGMAHRLKPLDVELASEGIREDRNWYVTPSGHTMIIITPPERAKLGSPAEELDRDTDEGESLCRIPRRFAISAKEVAQAQYLEFRDDFPHVPNEAAPSPDCPINAVHWYNASSYCRWLSTRDHFSEKDMCYPLVIRQGLRPHSDYLQRSGYRLPTESEWELAARAGSNTRFYHGHDAGMLGSYAWHLFNAEGKAHSVGEKMPNRLGLFDIQGNVSEWCFESYVAMRTADTEDLADTRPLSNDEPRSVRGGSYAAPTLAHRLANRRGDYPGTGSLQIGFRIARTIEPSNSKGPQE